jgi:hypothetical protein
MSDPQTPATLSQQVLTALLALIGGGGAVKAWDRWRNGRNGAPGRDARYIVRAIESNGDKVSGEVRALAEKTETLHTNVKILLDRRPMG